jgi:hypothetical protein
VVQLAENNELVAYSPMIGFVKIAFVHALRHLLLGTSHAFLLSLSRAVWC